MYTIQRMEMMEALVRSYAKLTVKQQAILKASILNRPVVDLGAGNGFLSRWMAQNGARLVYAVECHEEVERVEPPKNMHFLCHTFADYYAENRFIDFRRCVAVISWPQNNSTPGLVDLLKLFGTVVYIGKNTDGTCCGSPALFEYLMKRVLLAQVPDKRNVLHVYGPEVFVTPQYRSEDEIAGLLNIGLFKPVVYGTLSDNEPTIPYER